jgi:hypothetical protein
MRLNAALEYEKAREDEASWNKVILHKDGRFYHVYEWSAWLVKTVVCTEEFQRARQDNSILMAQHFITKNYDYVMLGFPVESLSKYISDYEDVKALEGDDLEISIPLPFGDGLAYDAMKSEFEQWRTECPIKEQNKGAGKNALKGVSQSAILSRSGIFQIVAQVLSYPVEKSTPAENIDFISNLKRQVAQLL